MNKTKHINDMCGMIMFYLYYSHREKCKIHKDKVNADSNLRNKQTHFVMENGQDGSKDVATVSTTVGVVDVVVVAIERQSYLLMR